LEAEDGGSAARKAQEPAKEEEEEGEEEEEEEEQEDKEREPPASSLLLLVPRLRLPLVGVFVLFHLAIAVTMDVCLFPWVGIAAWVARVGSMMTMFFQPGPGVVPVTGWKTASQSDTTRYAEFFWGMIDRGIYLPCSQYEALFFSSCHTEADIDRTITAAAECLAELPESPGSVTP
jgi:hypothetical protein